MSNVIFENVTKKYTAAYTAISDISFEIQDKEFVVLVGPSGCGKSTTLRMIAGLESATSGTIYIGGTDVAHVPPKDRNVSMVFQNYALYPHMTAYKNISFGLQIRKYTKKDIDARVHKASDMLGITHLLDKKPKTLSGGECQRVALGRAIVREPEIFLFDEPLSNLDSHLKSHMRAEIISLHKQLKTTFIYVTHDQIEAMTMADRIIVLKGGIIQQMDTPENIYRHPINKFVAEFLSYPKMNMIEVFIEKKENNLFASFEGISIQIPKELAEKRNLSAYINKRCLLGIRPENITPYTANTVNSSIASPQQIPLTIKYIENTGATSLIYGSLHSTDIVATCDTFLLHTLPEDTLYTFDMKSASFFDLETTMSTDYNNYLKALG